LQPVGPQAQPLRDFVFEDEVRRAGVSESLFDLRVQILVDLFAGGDLRGGPAVSSRLDAELRQVEGFPQRVRQGAGERSGFELQ